MLSTDILDQIKARALEIAAEFDRKDGPYSAELVANTDPHWHMLKVHPNKENKAADFLSARSFGVFLPKFDKGAKITVETRNSKGKMQKETVDLSNKLIFPGRLMLFTWDILRHWRRIMACPGVAQIVVDQLAHPLIVPDHEINKLQILQFILSVRTGKKRKRYGVQADDLMTISTSGFFMVDGEQRNRVLDRSLGLAS